ncbi:putative serine/threonine-protein kinase clkA [Metarhizium anisopliae]
MRGHSHRFVRLSEVPNTTYNINSQVDLKPDNILVKIEDPAILDRDARDEYVNPLPQKVTDKGIIYLSRNDYGQFSKPTGIIQITDFGSSVSGKTPHSGCIQAEAYRAPEVILDAGCSYSADIWSLGVMRIGEEYDERVHIAQLTGLLGPPPDDILSSGQRTSMFYTTDVPQDIEFEKTVTRISGLEKAKFLEFAKRMIRWNPSERSTARDLLKDPWLYEDYPSEM